METKQITLRSQTVQCQNCGEYYSVTYKYCPFCEYGKPEEKKGGSLFGSLRGSQESKKPAKKKPTAEGKKRRAPEPERKTEKRAKPATEPEKRTKPAAEPKKRIAQSKTRTPSDSEWKKSMGGYAEWYNSEEYEATRTRSVGPRKKTSEMTAEERAAYQAEREARAAERKRERERITRAAAIHEMYNQTPALVPDEDRPEDAPEAHIPVAQPQPTEVPVPPEPVAAPPEETAPVSSENIPLYLPDDVSANASEPVAPSDSVGEASPVVPEGQQEIPTEQEQAAEESAPESELDALLREIRDLLGDVPEPASVETPSQEVEAVPPPQPEPVIPAESLVQDTPLTAGELLAVPQTEEFTLEQIMKEVKQGLLDMPAEATPIMAPTAPAYAQQPTQDYAEGQPVYTEQPAQDYAEGQPVYTEQPAQDYAEGQPVYTEQPTQDYAEGQPVFPEQPMQEQTQPETAPEPQLPPVEPELLAAVAGGERKQPPIEKTVPAEKAEPKKKAKKKAPKGKRKLPLLPILSLIIIAVAVFIVVHSVVPAFRTGVLSGLGGEEAAQTEVIEDTAESFTLDQTELNFVEEGTKVTLIPVFEPEGSYAALQWTCDNWSVAYLDADGTVTSLAPGDAVITATMANGQSAQCTVHCAWGDNTAATSASDPVDDPAASTEAVPESGEPAFVTNDITLNSEGASKTLELVGEGQAKKWASSNPAVATVDQTGVVTAVSKGSASVTVEVGGKTLTCAVRCVW